MSITAELRILQTSDVHMHVLPYDYFRDAQDSTRGLALMKSEIAQARAEATTLLLDTGDLLQGTPMATRFATRDPRDHPAVHAVETLGYDALTLGNHDFNYGLERAQAFYDAMPCPVVQSNVTRTDGAAFFPETTVLHREVIGNDGAAHPIKIGLFGVVPPQILNWDRDILLGRVHVEDMLSAAHRAAQALRDQGADLIVALAHTGPAEGPQPDGAENRAHEIAALADVDVVLAGHSHKALPSDDYADMAGVDTIQSTMSGTPAMMPGANASHIARMALSLRKDADGWAITGHSAALRPLAGQRPCGEIIKRLRNHHARTRALITQEVGETHVPIYGAGFAFGFDAGQCIMAAAKRWRALPRIPKDLPLVVATAPYRIASAPNGLTLPPGPINRRDLFTLYPFPNAMCVLRTTGAILKEWLEHAARLFKQQRADIVGVLIDQSVPSYDFDTLHGLSYQIDPFAAAGDRIRDLCHDGAPLAADAQVYLATSSYRAHGGGSFPEAEVIWTDTLPITQVLEDYLAAHSPIATNGALGWTLTPHDGETTLITLGDPPKTQVIGLGHASLQTLAQQFQPPYMESREVGAGEHLANPVRSGRKQP